jgi:hypothetical protein
VRLSYNPSNTCLETVEMIVEHCPNLQFLRLVNLGRDVKEITATKMMKLRIRLKRELKKLATLYVKF